MNITQAATLITYDYDKLAGRAFEWPQNFECAVSRLQSYASQVNLITLKQFKQNC